MAKTQSIKKINLATASFPYTVDLDSNTSRYKLYGTLAVSADKQIIASGTPKEGQCVDFDFTGTVTVDSSHTLYIFGVALPGTLLQHKLKIHAEYTNTAWAVYMLVSMDAITATSGGVVIVGGTGFTTLAPGTAGKVIVDSGTAFAAVALTGDVTVNGSGTTAIGADKVTAAMVKDGDLLNAHLNAAAGIVFTKMAALTASKIPVLNSSGFIEAGTVDATKLAVINVTTAGTLEASKAVVVDGSKKINELDITALKLNGTSITATPAQINYLSNVTSDVQTQIDAGIAKMSNTVISADTTATAATLKNSYIADTAGGAVDLTLPDGATLAIGTPVELLQIGANVASLKPDGSDKIYPTTSYTVDVPSVSCSGTGKRIKAILISATEWQVIQSDPA